MHKYFVWLLLAIGVQTPLKASERIIDLASGQVITQQMFVQALAKKSYILLGELHDNAEHHRVRAELIQALKPSRPTVIAEHLSYGQKFVEQGNLLQGLQAAGFEPTGWDWPMHAPLFSAIVSDAIPLLGGNITLETARKLVREGEVALPEALRSYIVQATLGEDDQKRLDADLLDSHCGHIKSSMLSGLRLAQRGRDAAMFSAMLEVEKPAVLVAGNGHVRMDYGVPVFIKALASADAFISVGFVEDTDDFDTSLSGLKQQYHYVWVTAHQDRENPCASFMKK